MNTQLRCQTVGRGGFAGGAGTSQQHRLGTAAAHHVGHLGIILFVQRLIDPNQLPDASTIDQIVQIGNRITFHQLTPALTFPENAEEMGHFVVIRNPVRLQIVGENKQKTAFRRHHIPHLQITGGGAHFAVVIIGKITVGINIKIVQRP